MANITNIPASRVPLIDPKSGLMSREWYRFFLNLFTLMGNGSNTFSLTDLLIGPPIEVTEHENQVSLLNPLISENHNDMMMDAPIENHVEMIRSIQQIIETQPLLSQFGTLSYQNSDNVEITNGTIDGVNIGTTSQGTGKFTTITATTAFGCNGKTAQTAYSVGSASTDLASVITLANNIRTALINNGIAS